MKLNKMIALLLVLMLLLTACTTQPTEQAEPTAPATEPTVAESTETEAQTEPAQLDFFDAVFDTSQDAGKLTVRYLSLSTTEGVGKDAVTTGDCSVYTSPDGLVMLVDASNSPCADEILMQLGAMGIEKIDIFVLSHPHADHVGSFCAIADVYPIGQVYTNGHDYDTVTWQRCVTKMKELDIPCQTLAAGDSFMFGEEVTVTIYGPEPGANEEVAGGYQDANDGSVAMRIVYGESSFWTSGDLYVSGEESLVALHGEEIRSDVVKMNHHGKETSNGRTFVQALNPVIAVGMFDSVGNVTVARRYMAAGAQVFYNDPDGAIRISTTGDGTYDVQTQLLRQLDILPAPSEDGHYIITRAE